MAKKKVFQIGHALTEGLEETITAVHQYAGDMRIEVIPIKRIEVDPENPRDLMLNFNDIYFGLTDGDEHYARKLDELQRLQTIANSIREQGLINPIVVYKFGDKYRLVAGERRTLASILAGKAEIQAKILDNKPNELKISLLQWIENVERSDLTLWERLRNLDKIMQTYAVKKGIATDQITITELSHLIGCSKPHAINYKAVMLADDKIKLLIQENKIKNLEKAALLAGIESNDIKQKLVHNCLIGTSLKKLRILADQEQRQSRINQNKLKPISRRGRQTCSIQFGATKNLAVAKAIMDAIANHPRLAPFISDFSHVNWDDFQVVNSIFKQVVKKLEEFHA